MTFEEVAKKYPYFVVNSPCNPYNDGGNWIEELPNGWWDYMYALGDKINEVLDRAKVPRKVLYSEQIKEKFGGLRWYWSFSLEDGGADGVPDGLYEAVRDLIDKAETETLTLCSTCGKPAEWYSKGWILPYCQNCAEGWTVERNAKYHQERTVEQDFTKISS